MICLDTMVLIWGIQGKARPEQVGMIERTRRYLEALRDANEELMVPTPALAEYLQAFDAAERTKQQAAFERYFYMASFDSPAAYQAAGIARNARRPEGVHRQALKTDYQILGTAIAAGASRIVTDESDHFEKLADSRILVAGVPKIPEQKDLDFAPDENT